MDTDQEIMERRVIAMLLAGEDATLKILREQYARAQVLEREFTGAGFFTTFAIAEGAPALGKEHFHLGDVEAQIRGLQFGAGFVLHVRDGRIDCLEGYSYNEPWPSAVMDVRLSYIDGKHDIDALRRKWA